MQIKQAAAQCSLTEKAIRLYEEKGLITPTYTEKNGRQFRDYNEETVARLQTIATLRKSFFSIEQIAEILDHPENIPAVFASYRAELQKQYADLKPLISRAEEIDAASLSDVNAVSNAMTAPAPHGISDEALPTVHFRVWDEGASTDERERAYARYQKWIARWEKRYAMELAVRNVFERPFWKWIALSAVILSVTGWYLYTQPVVSDVHVTLQGYELVYEGNPVFLSHERIPEFDTFDDFRNTVIDTLPAPVKAVPHTLTLDGKRYHYLLNPNKTDYYEGVFHIDGFTIETGDLNGIRSGGTLTAEEAEAVFGDTFILWEPHNMHGSRIHIGTSIRIRYVRPEDGYILSDFHYYEEHGDNGALVFREGGNKETFFVFGANTEEEADRLFRQTIWTAFQEDFWNGYQANKE